MELKSGFWIEIVVKDMLEQANRYSTNTILIGYLIMVK